MAGSVLGEVFKVSTWGESHGAGVGVVVDGCPAGIDLCEEDIQRCLNRRKPGETRYSTPRKEGDVVRIMSGVFEGKTTGTTYFSCGRKYIPAFCGLFGDRQLLPPGTRRLYL